MVAEWILEQFADKKQQKFVPKDAGNYFKRLADTSSSELLERGSSARYRRLFYV